MASQRVYNSSNGSGCTGLASKIGAARGALGGAAAAAYLLHKKGVFNTAAAGNKPQQTTGASSPSMAPPRSFKGRDAQGAPRTRQRRGSRGTAGRYRVLSGGKVFVKEHSITRNGQQITIAGHYRSIEQNRR